MKPKTIDPHLLTWASDLQREAVEAINKHGSGRAAAKALGINKSSIDDRIKALQRKAAAAGYAPEHNYTHPVPEGFHLKGASQLYRRGEEAPLLTWVKSNKSQEDKFEMLKEACAALSEPFFALAQPLSKPTTCNADLMQVYPMGDPHFGMLAWKLETGEDFDLKIAETQLCAAVDLLVEMAPPAKRALIINLGDFFHTDNQTNRTSRSGNALDVDSRWTKLLQVGVRAMRRCIDRALEKHEEVHVINEIGNHDDHSSIMLAMVLDAFYHNEPRVTLDMSPAKYHYVRFGANLIGVTHGDTCKANALPMIMAQDRSADWGETTNRHWYTGHVHHDSLKEMVGCSVETFRTLAPGDAWHMAQGYRSGRDMKSDTWHVTKGRVTRQIVNVEQIR